MQFERMQHEQQGSGFGLILARKLAEFYEGSLDIESIYGKGTFIRVTIPGAVNGEDS
jgi:signal transduction histidine kinase